LRPQSLDVHVYSAGLNVRSSFPHRLQKIRPCLNSSTTLRQKNEEFVFRRGKVDGFTRQRHCVRRTVDRNVSDTKHFVALSLCPGASQNRLYSQDELGWTERFSEVVIGAQ